MTKLGRITTAEFKAFKPAKRFAGALFILTAAPNPRPVVQFACVVSKKISPKAVVRNTIKRRARAAVRSLDLSPLILVLTAKSDARSASFDEIRRDIGKLVARLG
jgi:ribonuclease P protein component